MYISFVYKYSTCVIIFDTQKYNYNMVSRAGWSTVFHNFLFFDEFLGHQRHWYERPTASEDIPARSPHHRTRLLPIGRNPKAQSPSAVRHALRPLARGSHAHPFQPRVAVRPNYEAVSEQLLRLATSCFWTGFYPISHWIICSCFPLSWSWWTN